MAETEIVPVANTGAPQTSAGSILIVDDDAEICDLLKRYFRKHGFEAETVNNGEELEQILKSRTFDLIILDVMLPGEDGFTLCQKLRNRSETPIIMVTASNEATDRIIGLELGADDYVAKPFNARELLARVKAVLRRLQPKLAETPKPLRFRHFGNWQLNCLTRELECNGKVTPITGPEYRLLEILLDSPNQIISRDALSYASRHLEHIPYDRTIDIQISRLRRLLREAGSDAEIIRTIRGEGYLLLAEVSNEY